MKTLRSIVIVLFLISLNAKANVDCNYIDILPDLHRRVIDIFTKSELENITRCSDKIVLRHDLVICNEDRIRINFNIKAYQYGRTFNQILYFDANLSGNTSKVTFRPLNAGKFKKLTLDDYALNLEYKTRPSIGKSSKIKMNFKLTNDEEIETFKLSRRYSGWFSRTKTWKCF
jgi:hypothetical protein